MVVPQTLPEALRLAADLAEQKQRLSEELAIAAPKAEFVDRYVKATGSMTFRQVAKLLNAKEPEFAMFLIENGIMYRLNRVLTPKSKHIEAGRLKLRQGPPTRLTTHSISPALLQRACAGLAACGLNILLRGKLRESHTDT
jgi:phage antirepressor YoqD-like protein